MKRLLLFLFALNSLAAFADRIPFDLTGTDGFILASALRSAEKQGNAAIQLSETPNGVTEILTSGDIVCQIENADDWGSCTVKPAGVRLEQSSGARIGSVLKLVKIAGNETVDVRDRSQFEVYTAKDVEVSCRLQESDVSAECNIRPN